jgi:hypothetical protein
MRPRFRAGRYFYLYAFVLQQRTNALSKANSTDFVPRQGQPLTAFKGTVNLGCFAGHATNLATCDPASF